MKYLYLLITSLLFLFPFQKDKFSNGIFEYEQVETTTKGFRSHVMFFNLNITNEFSTYSQIYTDELNEEYTESNENGVNDVIVVKAKKNEMQMVYNDFKNASLYFKDIVAFDVVYVKEENIQLKWVLSDETKQYGKRVCKKATTTFRGRTYTAWYLPEIKTKMGPWKFSNPPGLIFEIYDTDKVLHIKLRNLNTKKYSNINDWDNEKRKKIISLKEYIKLEEKAEDVILERLNSKLPKGSKPFIKNEEQQKIEIF